MIDGTIRYVNSRHGFEVQRYSSRNWLTIDVFSKDACQAQEKPFREMLEKKRQYERLSRSIFSSEYYQKRWQKALESYTEDNATHAEWAKQNYQLLCLRTLYSQATQREQRDRALDAQDARRTRAQTAYHRWKETKDEEHLQRQRSQQTTAHSQRPTDTGSSLANNSFLIPMTKSIDDMTMTVADTNSRRMSLSTDPDHDIPQPTLVSRKKSVDPRELYMYDEQRWSLRAMLKRVVGLAQPLPPPPKMPPRKQSPMTMTSNDSGFESIWSSAGTEDAADLRFSKKNNCTVVFNENMKK